MGVDHIVFIPGVILLGVVIGYVLGQRSMMARIATQKKRQKE